MNVTTVITIYVKSIGLADLATGVQTDELSYITVLYNMHNKKNADFPDVIAYFHGIVRHTSTVLIVRLLVQ